MKHKYFEVLRYGKKIAEFNQLEKAELWIGEKVFYGHEEESYEIVETELTEIFEHYNPHPQDKNVGDCVKRALTKVFELDYMKIQRELNRYKVTTGAKVFNENRNWMPFIEDKGAKRVSGFHRTRVWDFARQHPKGKFLVRVAKHVIAVVDGIIYDTWDSRNYSIGRVWEVQ